ncbi:VOC family protein [Paenibacillus sp. NPDC056579]|uniref:VOC family protein n=1 Tax=unclassified Paenibacillus TaxID=185978 RepID=UPI001EF80CF2|nr:VOC family protein [Paenibacillus sp. H1-7]ULL17793.1 VOC family protein [Paenibacillus sp. H1-7]
MSESKVSAIPFTQDIGNCYIHVYNFGKAYDFYTKTLGLVPAWTNDDPKKPLAGFNMENRVGFILVGMPEPVAPLPYAAFHFRCTDAAAARDYLIERGVQVGELAHDKHAFEFWDPEGNKLFTMDI